VKRYGSKREEYGRKKEETHHHLPLFCIKQWISVKKKTRDIITKKHAFPEEKRYVTELPHENDVSGEARDLLRITDINTPTKRTM
jgi:hypothetical protein